MKFYVISLGCPKNLTNSEEFSARLLAKGHKMVFTPQEADEIIINTCGFIDATHWNLKKRGLLKK